MSSPFHALGVPADLVSTLSARGIDAPFAIQELTLADAFAGRDVSGRAPTGSGKTLAFGLPLVAAIERAKPRRPHGLVLVPTRELAAQVAGELTWLGHGRRLRVAAVYGGTGYGPQLKRLRNGVDILVACPGRLIDLMERKEVILDALQFAVVDEADRMADMGFLPVVKKILDHAPDTRQTLLFSATLDGAVDELVRRYQRDPVRHTLAETEESASAATHAFWRVEREDRIRTCADLIRQSGPTIVFCRTKRGTDRVAEQLEKAGVRTEAIHGNRSQGQRERALSSFSSGRVDALIATDVAARGIHVDAVACVVHFDLPADVKDYTHRSGRTARAGAKGVVVSFVGRDQTKDAIAFQRQLELPSGFGKPGDLGLANTSDRARREPETVATARGPVERTTRRPGSRADRPEAAVARESRGPREAVAAAAHGTIKWFDHRKGFGFIGRPRGGDVFVHLSVFEAAGVSRPKQGQRVEYELTQGRRGDQASRVRLLAS